MAADEARAERIRELKSGRPDLTWRAIAEHVGVSERAAIDWQKTGGIEYEHAKKLAELFPDVTLDYIWRGEAPDLMAAVNGRPETQLDRIEHRQQEILAKVELLASALEGLSGDGEERGQEPESKTG